MASNLTGFMRKTFLIAIASLLASFAAASLDAQQLALPNQFGKWSGHPAVQEIETQASPDFQGIWKESGRTAGESADYTAGTGKVTVALEKYSDPSSAYEAYTAMISPEMKPSELGKNTAVLGGRLLALVGNFVLIAQPANDVSTEDLATLTAAVRAKADPTPLPPIRGFLPEQSLVNGTQRYSLGAAGFRHALADLGRPEFAGLADVLGFNSGAEVMLGQYKGGKGAAVLLLIDYPTPQLAEFHIHHLQVALSGNAKTSGTAIERKGSLLSLVLAPSSAAYARTLRDNVNYGTDLTWNEASQTATDPPLMSTLVKIIVGTGVFMLMAVVLGIAFGGVRILTKIFFPGKVFDRPEQMEILQLGLSGKPIDPRDFY